ncbi:uncharacterized protein LOC130725440 [Lotus japonicus]|uniref:uncharacterized protein LOC130725440 n=1 Tax=Lotus japonicus TaxID=34305 RepID=UPI00258734CB|nr:uncharacterized protein LOC130725440 [Lotus japonicus]
MTYDYQGSIFVPTAEGQDFELRPAFLSLIAQQQFGGGSLEDPHAHLERFIRNCSTYRVNNISSDSIRLASLHFSLRDTAEEWLNSQPRGSITTWEDLAEKFTTKFMPRFVLRRKGEEITNFAQSEAENLHEAWERYKRLLRKCPQHNMSEAEKITRFYDGLLYSVKSTFDAAAKGEFDSLPPHEARMLIDNMAARAVNTISDRHTSKRVFEVEAVDQIIASNRQLAKQMHEMQKQFQEVKMMQAGRGCVTCGGPDCGDYCRVTTTEEEAKYMGQAPFSNNYNSSWRNNSNLAWGDRGNNYQKPYNNQNFQGQGARQQEQAPSGGKRSMEELFKSFLAQQDETARKHEEADKKRDAAMRNMENQIGQLAKRLSERESGQLPSDTQQPRLENASAITTRSGKVLPTVEVPVEKVVDEKVRVEKNKEKELKIREGEKSEVKENKVPFPKALMKKNLEKQFAKFVAMFRKLHVELPFSEVLEKMPQYSKFMKEILSKKRRLSEMDEVVMLSEECSAIIQRKLPVKMKDPGKFMLPVEFEGKGETKGLIDLGASVNLMPLSMFERLKIGELKGTMMHLQLADRSIVTPWGVCEDVLVKVGKFYFPADFVILDMDEEDEMPLIFGRPFLATTKVKIDVEKRVVSLKSYGKKMKIKMPDLQEKPKEKGDALLVDLMKIWSDESLESFFRKEGLPAKKEPLPAEKKALPVLEESHAVEEKKPPPVVKKQPVKGRPPWMSKFWRRKVLSSPVRGEQVCYVFDASFDEETPHGATHQGYNPG